MRKEERVRTMEMWHARLDEFIPGARIRTAICPHFRWIERNHDGLTYRTTQCLTGHGCFSSYLYRIGKAETNLCTNRVDTPEHTIASCDAWSVERGELCAGIGGELSNIVGEIVRSRAGLHGLLRTRDEGEGGCRESTPSGCGWFW